MLSHLPKITAFFYAEKVETDASQQQGQQTVLLGARRGDGRISDSHAGRQQIHVGRARTRTAATDIGGLESPDKGTATIRGDTHGIAEEVFIGAILGR